MFFTDMINKDSVPVLEKMLAFTQARHDVLVENIANVDTPGYKTQQLDPVAFQKSLRQAVEDRQSGGSLSSGSSALVVPSSDEVKQDATGRLRFTPSTEPAENILFHDQTNQRIEQQMSALAENAMMNQAATDLLRGQFQTLTKAISGRV